MGEREFTSRERVLGALAHEEPDRVPRNYAANPGIDAQLKAHFGLSPQDNDQLHRILGVDFAGVQAPYVGPKLHEDPPDRRADNWGVRTRCIAHGTGGYWDFCDFPLRHATVEEARSWPMPSPDEYDYGRARALAELQQERCVFVGMSGLGCIINRIGKLRGMDQILVDLLIDDPVAQVLIERKQKTELEVIERELEACRGLVDLLWMGEDLSTQRGPMISLELYRQRIRPWHERFVNIAKEHGLPVIFHSCGACSWLFEDFIEMGIDAVETLQPEAHGLAPKELKATFGDRLAFHGCIPTGGVMADGTPEQVREVCRQTLETMMPGGGYCFAPSHQLQDNTPLENALAMYESVEEFGVY